MRAAEGATSRARAGARAHRKDGDMCAVLRRFDMPVVHDHDDSQDPAAVDCQILQIPRIAALKLEVARRLPVRGA